MFAARITTADPVTFAEIRARQLHLENVGIFPTVEVSLNPVTVQVFQRSGTAKIYHC